MSGVGPCILVALLIIALPVLFYLAPRLYVLYMSYIGLPLRHWGDVQPSDLPFVDADIAAMPRYPAAALSRAARQLVPLGFTAAATLRAPGHFPGSDGYISVWLNEHDGAHAQVIALSVTREGLPLIEVNVVTFLTEFGDGGVGTSNTRDVSVFAHNPNWDSLRWPAMNALAALYRLHAFRVHRAAVPLESCRLPDPARIADYLRDQNLQTLRHQVAAGYFWFDDDSAQFRRRLKGAFLMTWKLLWPLRPLADRRNERKLSRDLAAAGMPPPEEHRPQPPGDPIDAPLSYRRPGEDEID